MCVWVVLENNVCSSVWVFISLSPPMYPSLTTFLLQDFSLLCSAPYISVCPRLLSLLQSVRQSVQCRAVRGAEDRGFMVFSPEEHLIQGQRVKFNWRMESLFPVMQPPPPNTHTTTTDHFFPFSTAWSSPIFLPASPKINHGGEISLSMLLVGHWNWKWTHSLVYTLGTRAVYSHKTTDRLCVLKAAVALQTESTYLCLE